MQIAIDIPSEMYNDIKSGKDGYSNYVHTAVRNGTPLPKGNKCKWIHYDYRTICPKKHDINNPYWMISENRIDALRYCPYCGKEIELDADSN